MPFTVDPVRGSTSFSADEDLTNWIETCADEQNMRDGVCTEFSFSTSLADKNQEFTVLSYRNNGYRGSRICVDSEFFISLADILGNAITFERVAWLRSPTTMASMGF